jgi:hypothetical protein
MRLAEEWMRPIVSFCGFSGDSQRDGRFVHVAAAFVSILWVALVSCSGDDGTEFARSGAINRSPQISDANFSIDLPPGWRIFENFSDMPLAGDIVTGYLFGPDNQQISYSLFGDTFVSAEELLSRLPPDPSLSNAVQTDFYMPLENSVVVTEFIAGVPVRFSRPAPDLEKRFAGIFSAYFEAIPGAPENAPPVQLVFREPGHRVNNDDIATEILRSVTWATLPPAPELVVAVTPRADWIMQVIEPPEARNPIFTVMTPPDWEFIEQHGIDALPGEFKTPDFSVRFEYGNLGTSGLSPYGLGANPEEYTPHFFWEEIVGGVYTQFHRPTGNNQNKRSIVGAFFPLIPGADYSRELGTNRGDKGLGVWATGLTTEQQETLLAVIRTIRHPE